jgi:hypothetical protein
MYILELAFSPDDDERLDAQARAPERLTAHHGGRGGHRRRPVRRPPGVRVVRLQEWDPLPL